MKRKLIVIPFALAACALCACGKNATVYDKLNGMMEGVDGYRMTVVTTVAGVSLTGSYDVVYTADGYEVSYEYETLNEIDLENPSSLKRTCKGTATVVGEQITATTGDPLVSIPDKLSLSFAKEYFSEVSDEKGEFSATVIDVDGFFGEDKSMDELDLLVKYEEQFTELSLSYETTSAAVSVRYRELK